MMLKGSDILEDLLYAAAKGYIDIPVYSTNARSDDETMCFNYSFRSDDLTNVSLRFFRNTDRDKPFVCLDCGIGLTHENWLKYQTCPNCSRGATREQYERAMI